MANVLTGNAGGNRLNGAAGADTLVGGLGNDTYLVDNAGDHLIEAVRGGTDTVRSSISFTLAANLENLVLAGTGGLKGTGNNLANRIVGGVGNDTLIGASGSDTLTGGAGADRFKFVTPGEGPDMITDFASGTDKIQVVSVNFANAPVGAVAARRFKLAGTILNNSDPVFLYNPSTGGLAFDNNGATPGGVTQVAVLTGSKTLVSSDIQVVAA